MDLTLVAFGMMVVAFIFFGAGFASGQRNAETYRVSSLQSLLRDSRSKADTYRRLYEASLRKMHQPTATSTDVSSWRFVLGFPENARPTKDQINEAYHRLAKLRHPDRGGSTPAMAALNVARNYALRTCAA